MDCYSCKNQQRVPGDFHIQCIKPPSSQLEIGSGGQERYTIAEKMANENRAVVRCIWRGSGWYPLAFDGNTVFGCCNYELK
jgi:hypothetical protein